MATTAVIPIKEFAQRRSMTLTMIPRASERAAKDEEQQREVNQQLTYRLSVCD